MSEDKPLDVLVGEALGWTELRAIGSDMIPGHRDYYRGRKPGNLLVGAIGHNDQLPHFSTSWEDGGPLIERFGIQLWRVPAVDFLGCPAEWRATHEEAEGAECAPTPLEAVCRLILALKAAGKLDAGKP